MRGQQLVLFKLLSSHRLPRSCGCGYCYCPIGVLLWNGGQLDGSWIRSSLFLAMTGVLQSSAPVIPRNISLHGTETNILGW